METKNIDIKSLEMNVGQVEGLPRNPRIWTRTDLDILKESIEETPELLEARGLIVYPHGDKFVAIGGNMRLAALREMEYEEAPCIILPVNTTLKKLKEIAAKDNGSFGKHDWEALANDWSDLPLAKWGISAWDVPGKDEQETEVEEGDDSTAPDEDTYVVKYEIIFDDERQQERWYEFLRGLKEQFPEAETIAERLDKYIQEICTGIGAHKDEVDLLLMDNVFQKMKFNEDSQYSKAWYPKPQK